ncbi:unnamed protein product [Hermetia illucens]|uniref:Uncharacterized protein n=1 Tax=Hermetia illucens TaxID=343691 RepID=A0A7R8YNG8_HERIL|nr:unnamed protein product [Hermetia illucens]
MDREVFMSFLVAVVNATAENYEQLAEFGSEEQLQSLDLYELAMDITRPAGHRVKVTTYDPKVKIELEPIMLEKGLCYTFNTALPSVFRNNVRKETKLRKPLACRYGKQECSLKVEAFDTSISLDIHSPYEFSDVYSHEIEMDRADEVSSTYKIMETVTSETLRDLSPHQRKCLYPDEDYPAFSKSICYMKCRGKMAMDMCNCIPHFYPFLDGPKCSPSGYECLLDFKWPGWSLSLCNCTRTCVELKYTVHNIIKRNWDAGSNITFATKASFNLEIMPPKVRNRISVVFSFEDLLAMLQCLQYAASSININLINKNINTIHAWV